jgi:8-amino-7-oxononanoate synthase
VSTHPDGSVHPNVPHEVRSRAQNDWDERVGERLDGIRAADRWRVVRDVDATGPVTGLIDGQEVVSFAANDYLGLTHHPAVVAAAHEALDRWGAGAGAARLIVGSRPVHTELEAALAEWKATEAALLFSTGFAANLGVLSTLGQADVTILSDELNHASIIDGTRLAKAAVRIYRHGDLDHLATLLVAADGPCLVVTDTVFSMDGDTADVDGLLAVAARHGALVVLDEAHAVLGPEVPADSEVPVLRVGTLSKTLGALGGFVAGPQHYVDLLRNAARPFIFTTASTPADAAAAGAALDVLRSAEGDALVSQLQGHVTRLRPGHPSPILPVVLGDEAAAIKAGQALRERGLLVPAIRPPTVPPGTSRLRVALSAAHTDPQVDALAQALAEIAP